MLGLNDQIWVTSATSDDEVTKALTLRHSLRRVFTTRKIAVIVSPNISVGLRQVLNREFDLVFFLDNDLNTAGLKLPDFAKLYALIALRSFGSCIYASPTLLALKNCDEIFTEKTDTFLLSKNSKDACIFLFKPSLLHFESLMTGLSKQPSDNREPFNAYLHSWTKNQTGSVGYLHDKFNCLLQNGKPTVGYEQDVSMANLTDFYKDENTTKLENTGILGKLIAVHWLKIKQEDVLPRLAQSSSFHPEVTSTLPNWKKEPIAVVGMSCRYPASSSLEEFWNLLSGGQDGTGTPPPHKWLREQCIKTKTDGRETNAGFLKDHVDEFDTKFFGMSPKEALFLDPQQRLIHELVWESLEDAGIDPHTLRGTSASVFLGSWLNDYKELLHQSSIYEFYRAYMGTSFGAATARISFLLGATGPSVATESGCSSASVAVHLACKSLLLGETNLALACGVNLLLHPFDKDCMPMVVSPDGHSRTFSEDANGFARAEGAGVLVLKRLSDAIKDGDHIWGLIRGSAISQEGLSKSLGTPTIYSESLAMMEALEDAKVSPEEVSYVEAHGTGTAVGDPMEVASIAKAYYSPKRQEPLIIGSVKTNVGHTESCSGITGIMKVILSMHHETIPAHLNFTTLNPAINLDAIPAKIPLEKMAWKKYPGKPRIAGVSSFGITGTDTHVIIEEAPTLTIPKALSVHSKIDITDRPFHIVKISAKTEEAMNILLGKYQDTLKTCEHSIADIAHTTNTGRSDFAVRTAIVTNSTADLCTKIEQHNFVKAEVNPDYMGKICFLFTGQGSQYPNMAKQLYDCSPVFRIHFDYCEDVLRTKYKVSIKDVLWSDRDAVPELSRTIYSQTSIFCVEYALLKLWEALGVKPDYALGHSLGEFAAVVCAGILSVDDAIMLVAERSRLIDSLPGGKMLVIKAAQQNVDGIMKKFSDGDPRKILDYAAVNSNQQTVVAGDTDVILEFSKFCTENNIKCIILDSSHAFHSKHMDPMLGEYKQVASTAVNLGTLGSCEYISGVTGDLIASGEVNAEYWIRHTRDKVCFLKASKKAVELGCKIFVEIGPKPVLSALTTMNNDGNLLCLPSLKQKESEWSTLLESLGKLYVKGVTINWAGLDQFCSRNKVRLPNYPFMGKKFWPDMTQTTGGTIHPLIGAAIPNASSTKLFQCGLNLRSHEYIKDHAIGQTAVFPGAGYLEMCLAAGLAAVQGSVDSLGKPTRPMKVENLGIQAPLAVEESKTCQVQTVVDFNMTESNRNDWNDVTVKIFHRIETEISGTWVPHATATFSPLPSAEEQMVNFDTEKFQNTLTTPADEDAISKVYDKLAGVGLKFGPVFRSLQRLWQDETEKSLLAQLNVPAVTDNQGVQYIIHPAVIDAMFQAIMVLKLTNKLKKKLYVPIKIGKFIWLSNGTPDSDERYIYVRDAVGKSGQSSGDDDLSTSRTTALLLDKNGKILAIMSEAEFIDTTVKMVETALKQQTIVMPDLWEEVWRPKHGPMMLVHNAVDCTKNNCHMEELRRQMAEKYDVPSPELEESYITFDQLVYYIMLRTMYKCGFEPVLHHVYQENDLISQLKINEKFVKMLGYFLRVLEEEGILENRGLGSWKLVKNPPSLETLEEWLISPKFTVDLVEKFRPTLLLMQLGKNLSSIIRAETSALAIMFPEEGKEKTYPSVGEFYETYGFFVPLNVMCREIGVKKHQFCAEHSKGKRSILRVCEIGAGTGVFARGCIQSLEEAGIEYEYTYTDISAAFFPAAEKEFEKYQKNMIFKRLNIEEDPISQGFVPEYYDHVVASDVIHATRNLKETLTHVKMLLKPGGRFDMVEMTRVNRLLTYLFGLLEGFWRFEDHDVRPDHCTLTNEKWQMVFEDAGYDYITAFPCMNKRHSYICTQRKLNDNMFPATQNRLAVATKDKLWLLFHQPENGTSSFLKTKLSVLPYRKLAVVTQGATFSINDRENYTEFTIRPESEEDYIKLMEYVEKSENAVLEGVLYCWSLVTSSCQTKILKPYFYLCKSLLVIQQSVTFKVIAFTNGASLMEDTDISQYTTSTIWGFTKSLQNERIELQCRCVDMGGDESESGTWQVFYEIWNVERVVQVVYKNLSRYIPKVTPMKPALSDLRLPAGSDRFRLMLPSSRSIGDLEFGSLEPILLEELDVEIQVKASSLNFRDVLSVLKPSEYFNDSNSVGFDFAGVIKRVGSGVSKWSVGDRVFGVNSARTALPSHIKQHEEDVLPVPDDMTFCEASTLPAVVTTSFLCLMDIAKITSSDTVLIHTASGGVGLSAIEICKHVGATIIATAGSKRKQTYLRSLGVAHVFHSRSTDYADDIMRVTNGQGVDVVLNSLTGEGFKEATLRACGEGARFVEMSKLSIWEPEEVQKLRPDVQYTTIDLTLMSAVELRRLMRKMGELVEAKIINPVPYVRFDGVHIREALQYLQKAKHIGKVSCVLPEVRHADGKTEVYTSMFHDNATYLITGGLGGIGFEVCKWMLEKGARYVLLAGRSPPTSTLQQKIVQLNSKYNAKVVTVQLDVSQYKDCEELFKVKLLEMGYPLLRGVMHAAGTLADGLIENQTWDNLSSTFKTKITGTMNLHELTKTNSRLEYFVLFSSMTALFGTPGQSNHSAGNTFEDAMALYRNSVGLPATSVNWGQWGEVGIATEVDLPGVKPFSNLQGLAGLEYSLKCQRTQTSIMNIDSFVLLSKLLPHVSYYLDERVWKATANAAGEIHVSSEVFWNQYDDVEERDAKVEIVKDYVRYIIKRILKLDDNDQVDDNGNLQEMGVDSLMFVEIKNALQALLGDRVTVNASAVKDCNTVELLSNALVKIIEGNEEEVNEMPTMEEVNSLIKEDCVLPDHIGRKEGQVTVPIEKVSTVLLTGCTGTLGPYVLRELCSRPEIATVYCLIRIKGHKLTIEQRLKNILKEKELLSDIDMNKVVCVTGNVASFHFGLESDQWEELCDKVEAVIHCSASVQHVEHYIKRKSDNDMRAINNGGLINILDFAGTGSKLKHVNLASSMLSVPGVDKDGILSEEWPEPEDFYGNTTIAYPITKFVGDILMKQAILERGIPGKVFRFPLIVGDSKTGRFVIDQNHLMLRYMFILKNGVMPSNPFPIVMAPVDICAKVSLQLFFNPSAPDEIYNIVYREPDVDQEFTNVAEKLGYKVDIVEFSEFAEKIRASTSDDSPFAMFKDVYKNDEDLMKHYATSATLRIYLIDGGRSELFVSKKLKQFTPDIFSNTSSSMDHVLRDLQFAKRQGWLEKYTK